MDVDVDADVEVDVDPEDDGVEPVVVSVVVSTQAGSCRVTVSVPGCGCDGAPDGSGGGVIVTGIRSASPGSPAAWHRSS